MTAITGTSATVGCGYTGTWGTADSLGANDKMIVDTIKFDKSPEELTETGIGSGVDLAADSSQGATTPTVTGSKTLYYNDAGGNIIFSFFGGESVTGNANGYTHSAHHNGFAQKFVTLAQCYAGQSVVEAASAAISALGFNLSNPKSYAKMNFTALANDIKWTGSTNNFATVSGVTLSNERKIFFQNTDTISISGSTVPVTDVDIQLTKDLESAREAKGSAGNSSPIPVGDPPFAGTVTVGLKTLADHTYFSGAAADSTFYMTVTLTGAAISGSANYTLQFRFPALKLIQEPQYETSSGGFNPLQLTFKVIDCTGAVPSGMYTRYPHLILINDKSALYLA